MGGKLVPKKNESYLQAVALAIAVPEQFFLPRRLQWLESLFGFWVEPLNVSGLKVTESIDD